MRERDEQLWSLVAAARPLADRTDLYDNSQAGSPFRHFAGYRHGQLSTLSGWPSWAPTTLGARDT